MLRGYFQFCNKAVVRTTVLLPFIHSADSLGAPLRDRVSVLLTQGVAESGGWAGLVFYGLPLTWDHTQCDLRNQSVTLRTSKHF